MNCLNVIARLGQAAELRALPNGTPVIQFTAAFDSGYGDRKVTTWIKCALFGKRATDKLAAYLVKGQQVGLTGEIKLEEWQGQDGTTQKTLKMMVNDLTLTGGQQSQSAPAQQSTRQEQQQAAQPAGNGPSDFDDDAPFSNYQYQTLV